MDDRDALGLQTEDAGEANNVEDGGYVIEEGVYILSNTTFHQASWRQILYFLSLRVHMFEMAMIKEFGVNLLSWIPAGDRRGGGGHLRLLLPSLEQLLPEAGEDLD